MHFLTLATNLLATACIITLAAPVADDTILPTALLEERQELGCGFVKFNHDDGQTLVADKNCHFDDRKRGYATNYFVRELCVCVFNSREGCPEEDNIVKAVGEAEASIKGTSAKWFKCSLNLAGFGGGFRRPPSSHPPHHRRSNQPPPPVDGMAALALVSFDTHGNMDPSFAIDAVNGCGVAKMEPSNIGPSLVNDNKCYKLEEAVTNF
ncbi:hypothetical protein P154DRAFT_567565 [Amniculicola lignicola CBS 123094]|uniref:Ecp2 effector protein domain-containing protein n=1 Tax=Amniculicola lignicola CBS 123094 TaxID=1392246 RepID=A0A6A5W4I1_9PLEO|nr:hypothetical protein P154DRAFT_567565 [Amniculicola lignicola CBS 123094]